MIGIFIYGVVVFGWCARPSGCSPGASSTRAGTARASSRAARSSARPRRARSRESPRGLPRPDEGLLDRALDLAVIPGYSRIGYALRGLDWQDAVAGTSAAPPW